jgi:hypothetical protein
MARSTVAQVTQIGAETTPGSPVPANKRLGSLSVALSPDQESSAFRPRGTKYPTVVAANKEWSSGDLEGSPTYDEVVYPLSSIFGAATISPILDGDDSPTGAVQWEFEPSSTEADGAVTFTVEQGDTTLTERAAFVLFTDFGMAFSRDEVGVSGSVIGQMLERGVTLTAGATPVVADLVPILPGQVCVYVADDPAELGLPASHVETALSVEPKFGSKYNPVWYLNCQEDSWSGYVETPEPDATVDLTVEADADGVEWANRFRTGQTMFIRVEALGPVIAAGTDGARYRLTWDLAVKVLEPGEYSDEDGLYAIAPSLQVVHDPTWGRATKVTVVNMVTGL